MNRSVYFSLLFFKWNKKGNNRETEMVLVFNASPNFFHHCELVKSTCNQDKNKSGLQSRLQSKTYSWTTVIPLLRIRTIGNLGSFFLGNSQIWREICPFLYMKTTKLLWEIWFALQEVNTFTWRCCRTKIYGIENLCTLYVDNTDVFMSVNSVGLCRTSSRLLILS